MKRVTKKNKNLIDGRVNKDNFLEGVVDKESNQVRIYTKDMLLKRIHRDSKKIAKSFDRLCKEELIEISELFSKSAFIVSDGFIRAFKKDDEVKVTSGKLLMNAINTIQSSVELLRTGYILQPGMMLRSVIETVSTVAYFMLEVDGHKKYLEGKLDVNKIIKYGKQVIPPLGHFQGMLSNRFVHISNLHSEFNIISEYKEMSNPLRVNLDIIKTSTWLIHIVSELVFFDYFTKRFYWIEVDKDKYKFSISNETQAWLDKFFKRV